MKRFQIAVAGCGGMSNTWVEYVKTREDAEIVALVDINADNAKRMADKHGLTCGIYGDIEEAIRQSGANVVFDVTIPEAHYNVTTAALESGCHVFGEKPMASSMELARKMIGVAREHGKLYAIMQNRRYIKTIRALKQLISTGTIGTPGFITADFFIGAHFGGFRDLMDSPLILDMAIHTFDQARFIVGSDPVSVYCHEFNPAGSWYKGNASAVCIFEFANGSVFSYNGSWCAEGAQTSWEADWRIVGSLGTARWNGHEVPYAEVVADPAQTGVFHRDTVRVDASVDWAGREGHFGCLDEMFAALAEGRDAETVCTDNIKSMSMVFGAIESARTGRKVMLND